eukprot:gene23782-30050_t
MSEAQTDDEEESDDDEESAPVEVSESDINRSLAKGLTLEGSSRWQVYEPVKGDELPRGAGLYIPDPLDESSSKSNKTEKIATLQATLRTGDSLYIPRGWTFVQHNESTDTQSLTLKISPNLGGHCVADLLDLLVPQALAEAAQSSVLFRQSLPSDYRTFLG